MLINSNAIREQRDRINKIVDTKDSFVPRCILITGTTANATSTTIHLPNYINIGNILGAFFMIYDGAYNSNFWYILVDWADASLTRVYDPDFEYNQETNAIKLNNIVGTQMKNEQYRLSVFYKG